ncbi:InlB B-repeat-containing protein [Mycoplasmatota bacterium zrk1]
MKRVLLIIILLIIIPKEATRAYDVSDCEYFVLPTLGINQYQLCLQNPNNYSEHFIYHTVKFYNGVVLHDQDDVRDGDSAITPTNPSRVGYQFTGWDRSYSNITSNLNVYAKFEVRDYNVVFKDYDGGTLKTETVVHGENANPPSVSRIGYDFTGWSNNFTNIDSDRTLFAEYERITHTVNFYDYYNDLIKSEIVNHDYDATPPAIPVVTGKKFIGWDKSYTNVISNLDIYARYEAREYTVTFKDYDGSTLKSVKVDYGDDASPPSASRIGYTFTGWSGSYLDINSSRTLIAEYIVNKYTVNFFVENELIKTEYVLFGYSCTPPDAPLITGYHFIGWDSESSSIYMNKDIHSIYEINKYQVTFKDYDGSTIKTDIVEHGFNANPPVAFREGYSFIGWSGEYNNISSDITLIAEYSISTFTVDYYGYDGIILSEEVNYGYSGNPPTPPIVEGYHFVCWEEDYENIDSNRSIHALYEVNNYNVYLRDYNGTTIDSYIVSYGDELVIDDPIREGYDFIGWSGDISNVVSDITVIATYEIKEFTVNFYCFEELVSAVTVDYNKDALLPETINVEGYNFLNWSSNYQNIVNDTDVHAVYEKNKYTVTFMNYDFKILKVEEVYYGESASPPIARKEDASFTSWSDTYDNITSDVTIIAQFDEKIHTVMFYGFEGKIIDEFIVNDNSDATPPIPPTVNGYEFVKWDGDYLEVLEDRQIYAVYKKISDPTNSNDEPSEDDSEVVVDIVIDEEINDDIIYNVLFFDIHGNLLERFQVTESSDIQYDAPVVIGYNFIGWDQSLTDISSNLVVNPIYERMCYHVSFYLDDTIISEKVVNHRETIIAPNVSKEGHNFLGWSESLVDITSDLKIYAIFDSHIYTVKFLDINNKVIRTDIVTSSNLINPPIIERAGYKILGWDKDLSSINSDLIVKPVFEIMEDYEKIKFDLPQFKNYTIVSIDDKTKIKIRFTGDFDYELDYIYVNDSFYSADNIDITYDKKTIFDFSPNWIEIIINEQNVDLQKIVFMKDGKEYSFDFQYENKSLVNNLFSDAPLTSSLELSMFDKLILWLKALFN